MIVFRKVLVVALAVSSCAGQHRSLFDTVLDPDRAPSLQTPEENLDPKQGSSSGVSMGVVKPRHSTKSLFSDGGMRMSHGQDPVQENKMPITNTIPNKKLHQYLETNTNSQTASARIGVGSLFDSTDYESRKRKYQVHKNSLFDTTTLGNNKNNGIGDVDLKYLQSALTDFGDIKNNEKRMVDLEFLQSALSDFGGTKNHEKRTVDLGFIQSGLDLLTLFGPILSSVQPTSFPQQVHPPFFNGPSSSVDSALNYEALLDDDVSNALELIATALDLTQANEEIPQNTNRNNRLKQALEYLRRMKQQQQDLQTALTMIQSYQDPLTKNSYSENLELKLANALFDRDISSLNQLTQQEQRNLQTIINMLNGVVNENPQPQIPTPSFDYLLPTNTAVSAPSSSSLLPNNPPAPPPSTTTISPDIVYLPPVTLPLQDDSNKDETYDWRPVVQNSDTSPNDPVQNNNQQNTQVYHYHYHLSGSEDELFRNNYNNKSVTVTSNFSLDNPSQVLTAPNRDQSFTPSRTYNVQRQPWSNGISNTPTTEISSYAEGYSPSVLNPTPPPANPSSRYGPPIPTLPPSLPQRTYGPPPTLPPSLPPTPTPMTYGPPMTYKRPEVLPPQLPPAPPPQTYGPPQVSTVPSIPPMTYGPPVTFPPSLPPMTYGPPVTRPPSLPPTTPPPKTYGPPPAPQVPSVPTPPPVTYGPPITLPPAEPPTPPPRVYGPPRPQNPPSPPPRTYGAPTLPQNPTMPPPRTYGAPPVIQNPIIQNPIIQNPVIQNPPAPPPQTYGVPLPVFPALPALQPIQTPQLQPQLMPQTPSTQYGTPLQNPLSNNNQFNNALNARPNIFVFEPPSKPPKLPFKFKKGSIVAFRPVGNQVPGRFVQAQQQRNPNLQQQRDPILQQQTALTQQYQNNQQILQQQRQQLDQLNNLQIRIRVQDIQRQQLRNNLLNGLKKTNKQKFSSDKSKSLFYKGAMLLSGLTMLPALGLGRKKRNVDNYQIYSNPHNSTNTKDAVHQYLPYLTKDDLPAKAWSELEAALPPKAIQHNRACLKKSFCNLMAEIEGTPLHPDFINKYKEMFLLPLRSPVVANVLEDASNEKGLSVCSSIYCRPIYIK